ncbi:unnamed protein product [Caenorhabditis auriculariae]|uniref:Uncharacterized protein n=1 Tax=Caenorhabditis auriculariae TaxID=2777116 RepID=A0A8S1HM70_9PELO|nr:unnamed protein product [Caenorhabditis auriculariae]
MYEGIHAKNLIWMNIVLFAFSMLCFIVCSATVVFVRWAYKRRLRNKTGEMEEKYKNEEALRKDLELREKRASILPQFAGHHDMHHNIETLARPHVVVVERQTETPPRVLAQREIPQAVVQADHSQPVVDLTKTRSGSSSRMGSAAFLTQMEKNVKKSSKNNRNENLPKGGPLDTGIQKNLADNNQVKFDGIIPANLIPIELKEEEKKETSLPKKESSGKVSAPTEPKPVINNNNKNKSSEPSTSTPKDRKKKVADSPAEFIDGSSSLARQPSLFPYFQGKSASSTASVSTQPTNSKSSRAVLMSANKVSEKTGTSKESATENDAKVSPMTTSVGKREPSEPESTYSTKLWDKAAMYYPRGKLNLEHDEQPLYNNKVSRTEPLSQELWSNEEADTKMQKLARARLERRQERRRRRDNCDPTQLDETPPKRKFEARLATVKEGTADEKST